MARVDQTPERLSAALDGYLWKCQEQGKRPFIVMAPHLNIWGYLATLDPNKLNPLTLDAEAAVQKDLEWTRKVTPIVLGRLSAAGYQIVGYAHSWGGTMAAEGIKQNSPKVPILTMMNARVPISNLEGLVGNGLVGRIRRITTYFDAPTYFGKAAFGKGDIHIKHAEVPGWGNPITDHNIVLRDGSTPVTVEVDGVTLRTDLGRVLREDFRALPGDLIVRHGKNMLGPPLLTAISKMTGGTVQMEDIPHVGLLLENGKAFDLRVEQVEGKDHGKIYKADWNDASRFKNPGFFSVLESTIPIRFNGKQMTFKDLPPEVKTEVRKKSCDIAEGYVGKDVGEYGARNHCGDATIRVYDEALATLGITVLRYKGPFAFTNWLPGMRNKGLVDGKLRDWLVNDWFTAGSVMDPSEANDKLERVGPPETFSISDAAHGSHESGVSMQMDMKPKSIRKDDSGRLEELRNEAFKNRPEPDSLIWPTNKEENKR